MLVDKLLGVKATLPENLDLIVTRLFLDLGRNYSWLISVSFHKQDTQNNKILWKKIEI